MTQNPMAKIDFMLYFDVYVCLPSKKEENISIKSMKSIEDYLDSQWKPSTFYPYVTDGFLAANGIAIAAAINVVNHIIVCENVIHIIIKWIHGNDHNIYAWARESRAEKRWQITSICKQWNEFPAEKPTSWLFVLFHCSRIQSTNNFIFMYVYCVYNNEWSTKKNKMLSD